MQSRLVVAVSLGLLTTLQLGRGVAAPMAGTRGEAGVGRRQRAPLSATELEKLRDRLSAAELDTVLATVQALGDSTAGNAALPLIELLAVGTHPAAATTAIRALQKLRDPSAIEVLIVYAGHRSPEIRRPAVEALGVFAEGRVVPTLMERLGDEVAEVRGAAAAALATRNEKSAAPRMLALFKRNDAAAAEPLGALAAPSTVPELAELQGSVDDDNLASTLGELLKRQDVRESLRVDIIKTLAHVPGAASTTALIEYVGTLPATDRRPSKAEAQKLIDERAKQ